MSNELIEQTTGFAIGDPLGRVHRGADGREMFFKDFASVSRAVSGATVSFDVKVDVDDDSEDEPGNGELDGEARRLRDRTYNPDRN